VSLSVGILGPPNAGKTTLFNVLTGAGATVSGRENVGMTPVADVRLDRVAEVIGSKKVTSASIRVVDVPGGAAQLLGNMRQTDALLLVLDGWSGTRDPEEDRIAGGLELVMADREHVERRLERVAKQAKSGDPGLREEEATLRRLAAHLDGGEPVASFPEPIPVELEPLTTKPLLDVVNGPGGIDLKLESELAELTEDEAAAFREGSSALEEVVRRLFSALDLVSFFTARETEARAWTLPRGRTALDAAAAVHSDIAHGFIRAEVIRWDDLVECGSHAEAARRGLQRLEGKGYVVEDGDVLNIRFSPPREGS
jgi:ribosome-binding ATPase YchF (GTP1/OBG family)